MGIASTRNDKRTKVENSSKNALIYLQAFNFCKIKLNGASANKSKFCNNSLIRECKFCCDISNDGCNPEKQAKTKNRK